MLGGVMLNSNGMGMFSDKWRRCRMWARKSGWWGVKIQVLDSSKMKNLFDVCSIQAYTSIIPPTLHF